MCTETNHWNIRYFHPFFVGFSIKKTRAQDVLKVHLPHVQQQLVLVCNCICICIYDYIWICTLRGRFPSHLPHNAPQRQLMVTSVCWTQFTNEWYARSSGVMSPRFCSLCWPCLIFWCTQFMVVISSNNLGGLNAVEMCNTNTLIPT